MEIIAIVGFSTNIVTHFQKIGLKAIVAADPVGVNHMQIVEIL